MKIQKKEHIEKKQQQQPADSRLDEMVRNLLLSRKERLCCVAVFSTFSIIFLQAFHMFFLWRYSIIGAIAAGVEQPPQSKIFFYILGILAILIAYGIFAAYQESISPWVVFSISIIILILPVVAIGAEAYEFYQFHEVLHGALHSTASQTAANSL